MGRTVLARQKDDLDALRNTVKSSMTLEDFFTLTEMKDGLTAPSRVQELVSVMQKEKDSEVKNAADATRQWAAVASTIAATENKDCLDLFIQLDGLCFINRWLMDAQNFGVDANDSFVEESIATMLRAIEKLHIDSEKSMSSGIHITVTNLLGHHSTRVQDRARTLFDSWKGVGNVDIESNNVELAKVDNASDKIVREEGQSSAANEAGNDNDHASGLIGSEKSPLRSSDKLPLHSSDDVFQLSASVECIDIKEGSSANHVADVPSSAQEVVPAHEGFPICNTGETTSAGTCSFHVPNQSSFEGQSDVVESSDLPKMEKQEQNINNDPPEKLGAPENCCVTSKPEAEPFSMVACEAKAPESVKEPALEQNVEHSEDVGSCKLTTSASMSTPASDKSGEDDVRTVTSIIQVLKAAENENDCCSNALPDTSVSDSNLGKTEALDMSVSGTEYVTASKEGKGHVYNDEDTSIGSGSSKPGIDFRSSNIVDKMVSDNELDCGIVDALEFARQVAQEVNREVSSSSEKISEGRIRQPGSPDSVTPVPPKEVSSRQSHAAEACLAEGHTRILDNNEAELECRSDVVSLKVTETAQDSGGNSEKRLCGFDLNEVGADEMDVSVNTTSTPIPVVSASRPVPTPGLPGGPLQFEGTLGWKGSAATSAFRPASPRKNCDIERNFSNDMNFDTSKQRQDWLDFDLNVAEGEEGNVKPIAEPSGRPSGQSSVEFSPKKSSRLEFDLNSTGDDGETDQRMEGQLFLGRNGYWSPSPASSSSSMQPSVRNIDLNDRPCLQTDLVDKGPSKSAHLINAFGCSKSSDAPVISLLGAKVEVGKKECVPQTLSLQNGKAIEPAIDLTMSRAGGILGMTPTIPFNHSPVFGYNGVASASVAPTMSFSSAVYGSGATVPYMVDSRGAPVVPQVGGSSSTVLSSYSQPPMFMNMTGTQLGLNGFGPSRPNFDLNSGFMIEGGNRDTLAARQFFFPGQGRTVEEQVRTMPQPSSSGVSGKRKEPDSGLEPYQFSYKHQQPPWK